MKKWKEKKREEIWEDKSTGNEMKEKRNEMKERSVLCKRIWKKELKGGAHFKADIIWGIVKNSDQTYSDKEYARKE